MLLLLLLLPLFYSYACERERVRSYSSFRLIVISVFGDFIARDAFIFLLWSHTSILIYCVLLVWSVCYSQRLCHTDWTTYYVYVFMGPTVCL